MSEDWLDVLEIVTVILGFMLYSHTMHNLILQFEHEEDVQGVQEMNRSRVQLCWRTVFNLFPSLSFSE